MKDTVKTTSNGSAQKATSTAKTPKAVTPTIDTSTTIVDTQGVLKPSVELISHKKSKVGNLEDYCKKSLDKISVLKLLENNLYF